MRIVVDSSTLISLAWSGQLELLNYAPLPLVIPLEVQRETIAEGLVRGYPDAAAIEQTVKAISSPTPEADLLPETHPVDHAVLEAGRREGALATNDLALGRRAANLGVQWLRTADYVVLCVRTAAINDSRGVAALKALRSAGRITEDLLNAYLKDLS